MEKDLLLDSLSEEQRNRLGKIHPSFMGGEYLPDYVEGEVEIARIELESTTADVHQHSYKERENAHCIVDEYEPQFFVSPSNTDKPLTLAELVSLIDGGMQEKSLGIYYTQMNYSGESIEDLNRIRSFTRVASLFYPQLNLHYEKVLDYWYQEEKAKLADRLGGRTESAREPARGAGRAQLASGVDQHWYCVGISCYYPANVGDKAAVVHVQTRGANADYVTGRGDVVASSSPQGGRRNVIVFGESQSTFGSSRTKVRRVVLTALTNQMRLRA